jgi:hypothetical protein
MRVEIIFRGKDGDERKFIMLPEQKSIFCICKAKDFQRNKREEEKWKDFYNLSKFYWLGNLELW